MKTARKRKARAKWPGGLPWRYGVDPEAVMIEITP